MSEVDSVRFIFSIAWVILTMTLFLNIGTGSLLGMHCRKPMLDGLFYSFLSAVVFFLGLKLDELNGFVGPFGVLERSLSIYIAPAVAIFYAVSVLVFLAKTAWDLNREDFESLGDGPLPEDRLDPAAFEKVGAIEV